MKPAILGLILCVTASPLWAEARILGAWTCTGQHGDSRMEATVQFDRKGRMKAVMSLAYLEDGQVITKAKVRYRSTYAFKDGRLHDHPRSARILEFTTRGVNKPDGLDARKLEYNLLKDGTVSDVLFPAPDRLRVRAVDSGVVTNCRR